MRRSARGRCPLLADKLVFILARKRRAIVARYVQTGKRRFEIQCAANWEALESEAAEAVSRAARWPTMGTTRAWLCWPNRRFSRKHRSEIGHGETKTARKGCLPGSFELAVKLIALVVRWTSQEWLLAYTECLRCLNRGSVSAERPVPQ